MQCIVYLGPQRLGSGGHQVPGLILGTRNGSLKHLKKNSAAVSQSRSQRTGSWAKFETKNR